EHSFAELNEAGVNTIRFWLFNDGSPEGFQPTAGGFNEAAFRKSDLILSLANQYNMKLIPVLVNNWEEYGGREQYLEWIGKDPVETDVFYTDPAAKELYKNYLNVVLSRHNHSTGT